MIVTPFAALILDKIGIKITVTIAAILQFLGSWIRYFPGSKPQFYWALLAGQTLCGIAQPFLLTPPPKVNTRLTT